MFTIDYSVLFIYISIVQYLLNIDGCTISLISGWSIDTDCTDNAGLIDPAIDSTASQQAITISTLSFTNYSVTNGVAWEFILTHSGAAIAWNPIITTIGTMSGTTTDTVIWVSGVAQVVDFIPILPTDGETYRATINGIDYDYTVVWNITIQQVVEALQPIMDANTDVTCTEDDVKVTCIADVAGTAFTYNATVVDITAPVVSEVTPVSPVLTNDTTPDYTFSSTETGSIIYSGWCSSLTTTAISGNNTITLDTLIDGVYSSCTVTVVDSYSNTGNIITLSPFTVDATSPTVILTGTPNPTNDFFIVTGTFSEGVTWLTLSDFVLTNGIASSFTVVNSWEYSFRVDPIINGPITVDLTWWAAFDFANNPNSPSSQLSVIFDGLTPIPTLTTTVPNPTNTSFVVVVTFRDWLSGSIEAITWLTIWDFTVSNATKTMFTKISTWVYSILVSPTSVGPVTITVPSNSVTDIAWNSNFVSNTLVINYDNIPPIVMLSWSSTITLPYGSGYSEAGASWTDNVDGSGNIFTWVYGTTGSFQVSGTVNTSIAWTYVLQYRKVDAAGNSTTITRTIIITQPVIASNGGGGGWGSASRDYCPNWDYTSSFYDNQCGSRPNTMTGTTEVSSWTIFSWDINTVSCTQPDYTLSSFQKITTESEKRSFIVCWLYHNQQTIFSTVSEFKYDRIVTREEAARMIGNFVKQVLNKAPMRSSTSKVCQYPDINSALPWLIPFIKQSCEYGVFNGSKDTGNFSPKSALLQSHAIAIVLRSSYGYADEKTPTIWFSPYVDIISQKNLGWTWFKVPKNISQLNEKGMTRGNLWELMYKVAIDIIGSN